MRGQRQRDAGRDAVDLHAVGEGRAEAAVDVVDCIRHVVTCEKTTEPSTFLDRSGTWTV